MRTTLCREERNTCRLTPGSWVVLAVMFVALFVAAGVRATPGVLMLDLEGDFGWTAVTISSAISVSLFLYGLAGPVAAALAARWGIRTVMLVAFSLIATGMATNNTDAAIASCDFWLLTGTFFVCGATTSGLIATHFVAACADHGLSKQTGAGFLALMGVFDLAGTTISGWLSDRYNNRMLLAAYYGFRGISLLALPSVLNQSGWLFFFAAGYGLNWIATVPPTVRLTADRFGHDRVGVLFGWMIVAHQLGAALASVSAGTVRTVRGSYDLSFWLGGAFCLVAAAAMLATRRPAGAPHE